MNAGLELLFRLRQAGAAGQPIAADDARALQVRIDQAVGGKSEAEAFGFGPGWRRDMARWIGAAFDLAPSRPGRMSVAKRARVMRAELEAYHRVAFKRDLKLGRRPAGEAGLQYDYLVSKGGKPPSERTLRRELANTPPPAGQLSSASTTSTKRGS